MAGFAIGELVAGRLNLTLVQLRYFVAAAELGSMTGASKQLMVAQSALSAAVAHVERELGVQLLVRHHAKGLTLTGAGERFLVEAKDLLAHAAEVADSGRGLAASLTGELSVGCFITVAPFCLPGLLLDFTTANPEVDISIVEGEIEAVQSALLVGACDLALVYDTGLAPGIETELLATAEPYALLPIDHSLAKNDAVRLADLALEPMVMLDLPHSREYFLSLIRGAGVEPRIRFRTTSFETVRGMVGRGHGYSILNLRPAGDLTYDGEKVAVRRLRDDVAPLSLVLARRRGARQTRRALAFAASCRRYFGARRMWSDAGAAEIDKNEAR
jgi:DNA-binding transcriptional LysR family regulator